nr:putative ribonuclease h protein [Quercus suber]
MFPGLVGGGGIIRNSNGEWVSGYARAIRCTTSVAAELWALRDGLNICINLRLPAVEVELDAKLVVDLLDKENSGLNGNDVLVADCKDRVKQIPRVRILHYFREANMCADALARRGARQFNLDTVGIVYERFCSHVADF